MIRCTLKKHARIHIEKRLRRNFILLAFNEFLAELRLYYPVAVLVFESITGSFVTAMAVFSILKISQALSEIPTGIFSDRIGRRNTFIVGSFAELIGGCCYFLAFYLPYGALWLYIGSVFFGVAYSLFSGNNDALIYETLSNYRKPKEMPQIYGQLRSMGQAALALSGLLAGLCLWLGLSYQSLVMLSLVPLLLSFLVSFFIIDPPRKAEPNHTSLEHLVSAAKLIYKNPKLFKVACASSIKNGLGDSSHSLVPGFIETLWPTFLTPLFRTAQNLLGMFSFWFSGRIVKKIGVVKSLYAGTLYSYVMYFIGCATAAVYSPLLLLTTQLSYAVSSSADVSLQQDEFSDKQRATMGSIISIATTFVGAMGSVLIGLFADLFGVQMALIIMLIMAMPSAYIYFILFKKNA